MSNAYASGKHLEVLLGYLGNIERLAGQVKSFEDYQMISVDLLDNVKAAMTLLRGMIMPASVGAEK